MNGQVSGPYEEVAAYGLLNLRVDVLGILGSEFNASIFVTNATNKVYVTRLSETYMAYGTAGVTYGEPRIIGGQLRYRFGR
jgi:iron complex outermembrane receptor protein